MTALDAAPVAALGGAVLAYVLGVRRLRRRGDRWGAARLWATVAGAACLATALLPPVATHDDSFDVHVVQHVLLGMAGPALLVLGAPVTLALRSLRGSARRSLLRVLHSRALRVLVAPPTAVLLSVGGLCAVYLTPVYAALENKPLLHAAVHAHAAASGALLAYVVAGVDPLSRRPGVAVRLATLVAAAAGHDVVATLLYARGLPAGAGSPAQRHAGAELMYYAGTAVDLALAVVLMAQWWRVSGRALTRARALAAGPATRPAGGAGAARRLPQP